MTEEQVSRLALRLSRGVSEIHFHRLLQRFGSARAALGAPVVALMDAGLPRGFAVGLCDGHAQRAADLERDRAAALGVRLLCFGDADYPAPLYELLDPPPVLWCKGALPPDGARRVAIVGTRAPDAYGVTQATRLARGVAQAGAWVISGGARGIDAAAHQGALHGGGGTLVVVGTGLDVPYPADHVGLFAEILRRGGGIVSELALGTWPRRGTFPRRNRIIAAMAQALVVVQAAQRSGALVTAGQAESLGRLVLAVPGPVDAPPSAGVHALLREGARLCEGPDDLLRAAEIERPPASRPLSPLAPHDHPPPAGTCSDLFPRNPAAQTTPIPGSDAARLYDALGRDGASFDELTSRTAMDLRRTAEVLVQMELDGVVVLRRSLYQRA